MDLASSIKTKRKQERLSAQRLAEIIREETKVHVDENNVYKWQNGSIPQHPDVYTWIKNWLGEKPEIGKEPAKGTDPYHEKYIRLLEEQLEHYKRQIEAKLNKIDSNLTDASDDIIAGRAEIRAAIDYTVMKDSQGNEKKRAVLMEQINKLIHLQLTGAGGVGIDQAKSNGNN